jgi:AcrR family transcriptional regulator
MAFPAPQNRSPAAELGPRAQRTRSLLIATARAVFLEKGYGGTRVDDIADAAGTSRGTFYTYFPSKRDVLLAAGAETAREAERVILQLGDIPDKWKPEDLAKWIAAWIAFLDVHGSFLLVWGQGSYEDEQIRLAGVRTQLRTAKKMAETLVRMGHPAPVHAASDALAILGMMERLWYYHHVAGGMLDPDDMHESVLRIVMSILVGPPQAGRREDGGETPRA